MSRHNLLKVVPDCLIALLLILLIKPLFAQQNAELEAVRANKFYREAERLYNGYANQEALPKYQQAKALYLESGNHFLLLTDICFKIGIIYQEGGKFNKAIDAYKESLTFRQRNTPYDSSYFKPLVLIGNNFFRLNNYDSAQVYYIKAEQLVLRFPKVQEAYRVYNSMGALYDAMGNYKQGINYYDKALAIVKNSDNPSIQLIVNYNNNIAVSLRKLGKFRDALNKYKEILQYGLYIDYLEQNIGSTYFESHNYDSALVHFNKIRLSPSINTEIDLYNSLGTTYVKLNTAARASFYFDKAIQLSLSNLGNKNVALARSYLGKGQVYESLNNPQQALEQYQAALQALHFSFNLSNIYQNPIDFAGAVSGLHLFEALRLKAHAFQSYFKQTKQSQDLEASLQTYQLALQLADLVRKSYDSDEAKLFFTNTVFPVYEQAIGTAFQLYAQTNQPHYLHKAFAIAEQSKAAVLAESLRDLQIKRIPGIPPQLLQQERQLKQEITRANLQLVEEQDSTKRTAYQETIRNDEMALAQQVKQFEANPQYYQLKYDTSSVKIAQLQQQVLEPGTALVEYFLGKEHLYTFLVTKDGFQAHQTAVTPAFKHALSSLHKALYSLQPGTSYQGDGPAFALYQQLIQPLSASLQGIQRLIVVPDAELSYLPLEALVSDAATGRYLLQDYTISYAYSGKLLRNALERVSTQATESVLAMAPFATGEEKVAQLRNNLLSPLVASKEEVERIGGRIYLAGAATKELFVRTAGSYGIIHLATHAQADNEDPLNSFIAFYPRKGDSQSSYRLYTQELYNLRLEQVKLVVLSACETGSGQLVRGEGVMSLARAFAYAGCANVVTTLWKADDEATADIAAQMHQYLKAGQPKDEALRRAKLDYLEGQSGRKRAPFYWANFVFIGDAAPLYRSSHWLWWLVGGVLVLAGGVMMYRKKYFQSAITPP